MEVLLNELSLHGQFSSIDDFKNAIDTVMLARNKMKQFKRELYCYRNFSQTQVTHELNLQQAVQQLDRNKRATIMVWLTKEGPFWDDNRQHDADEYLEYQNQIVTDTPLAEVAYQCFNGNDYQAFSFSPSNYLVNPITVVWHRNNGTISSIDVTNHWQIPTLQASLQTALPAIKSWQQLASEMPIRCPNLTFSENSFSYLYPHPFVNSAAKRIIELLLTLDKFKTCFDEQKQMTNEGRHIYQEHFTGDKAWFSDSSNKEKTGFKNELTFNHPNDKLFCPWHGKVKTPQIRIHFSWPISTNEPLYVPYIGPKITKK